MDSFDEMIRSEIQRAVGHVEPAADLWSRVRHGITIARPRFWTAVAVAKDGIFMTKTRTERGSNLMLRPIYSGRKKIVAAAVFLALAGSGFVMAFSPGLPVQAAQAATRIEQLINNYTVHIIPQGVPIHDEGGPQGVPKSTLKASPGGNPVLINNHCVRIIPQGVPIHNEGVPQGVPK